MVRQHGHERHKRGEQDFRRIAHGGPDSAGEKAGALCHARAQHHHQHIAEWVEVGEGRRHLDPEPLDILRREQAFRADDKRVAILGHSRGMDRREVHESRGHRKQDQGDDQIDEDEDRIRQAIAGSFHPVEEPLLVVCPFPLVHALPSS